MIGKTVLDPPIRRVGGAAEDWALTGGERKEAAVPAVAIAAARALRSRGARGRVI
jgi:hypothetical protein